MTSADQPTPDNDALLRDMEVGLRTTLALSRVMVSALAAVSSSSRDAARIAIDAELDRTPACPDLRALRETLGRMQRHINSPDDRGEGVDGLERALIDAAAALGDDKVA